MGKKVLMGLSGGVDSTVSAILLQREGYEVEGVYMKLHDNEEYHRQNIAKAQRVGAYLGIAVHILDLTKEFRDEVYDYFVQSYRNGLTPNPCVKCNRMIKFGRLIEYANSKGIEYIATGHYVRTDGVWLYKGVDEGKDQSYFLCQINGEVIPRLLFPLGDWLKEDVKEFAQDIEILQDIATQKESSEICFVENDYTEVLERYMDIDLPGDVLDRTGNVIGSHKGYMHYTIGKRRGFFVNGAHDPHFVVAIKPETNQIIVGKRGELEESAFEVSHLNLFESTEKLACEIKVRYRTKGIVGSVERDTLDEQRATVRLGEGVFGLAIGQAAAFYDGDRLLGGGTISKIIEGQLP